MTGQAQLIIVPCGASKREVASRAEDLYTGSYFTACLETAKMLADGNPADIRILSGGKGLLRLDDIIEPYEQRIDQPGHVTVEQVRAQARDQGLLQREVLGILAGAYRDVVASVWPEAKFPLVDVGAMGYQMAELKRMRERRYWHGTLF